MRALALTAQWCLNGAGAARDNRWERMLCTWVGGNLVQVSLTTNA